MEKTKIIAFFMAVFMACTFSLPAFADDITTPEEEIEIEEYQGAVSQKKLKYVEPYLTAVQGSNYRKTYYVLAASLHSGTPDVQYTLNGKWNP